MSDDAKRLEENRNRLGRLANTLFEEEDQDQGQDWKQKKNKDSAQS